MTQRASALIALTTVVVAFGVFRLAGETGLSDLGVPWGEGALKVAIWAVPSLIVVAIVWRLTPLEAIREIGLASNPLIGYAFGAIATLPMMAAWPVLGAARLTRSVVIGTVLLGPFAEEVLFRGLLFRQLYFRAGRPPFRAMIVSALAFGAAHLANVDIARAFTTTSALVDTLGLVGMASLAGVLFAWVAYRWDSLWPAIGLHSGLNLSWELLGVDSPAHDMFRGPHMLASDLATSTRVASVTLAVYLTWRLTRRRRRKPLRRDASTTRIVLRSSE